eukprot:1818780-Rhodomonas_salina.2
MLEILPVRICLRQCYAKRGTDIASDTLALCNVRYSHSVWYASTMHCAVLISRMAAHYLRGGCNRTCDATRGTDVEYGAT